MTQSSDKVLFSLNNFVLQNTYDILYVQQTCKWSAWLNSILTLLVTNCLQATLHRTNQKARSWANCVFKIPGCVTCVTKRFVSFVPESQLNAWYVGYGNSSKLHVCKVAVITPNYKIFVVNPLLKQSSNEPVRHDWNKIIVNKILSHHALKSFLKENNFCFKIW